MNRDKANGGFRNRKDEILFIDAKYLGKLVNRRTKILSGEDISKITEIYHEWKKSDGAYEDIKGFCNSATIGKVKEMDYVLTPERYVAFAEELEGFDFNERFSKLRAEFEEQLKEEEKLNELILENLNKVKLV